MERAQIKDPSRQVIPGRIHNRFQFVLRMLGLWLLATYLFTFLRNFGRPAQELQAMPIELYPTLSNSFLQFTLAGLFAGLVFAILELLLERPAIQKRSYGFILGLKFFLYSLLALGTLVFFQIIHSWILGESGAEMGWSRRVFRRSFVVVWVYFSLVASLVTFFLQINQKFGPGVLLKLLTGKYRRPREERRVFLFIDLRGSTTIAEKLGHVRYSKLVQDCFYDLTPVLVAHDARVYQYVGDEVILHWPLEEGVRHNQCVEAYFDFQRALEQNADYYQEHFGLQPFFKAGLHCGTITVAEVGVIKKEIAFHGDVLNTTSRIQQQCNRLQESLLASGEIARELVDLAPERIREVGEIELRGKNEKVKLMAISRANGGD